MATIDLSRHATNFAKHFEGARMQQGRVLTDDDFNEHARLNSEDARKTRVHVIGPSGTPDSGFQIDTPQLLNGKLTFVIKAGTMYLGGLRLVQERDEFYHLQKDWLQQGELASDRLAVPVASRFDLVYLEAWQQPVTAVEDNELFEVALGARDTSARVRTMRRVRVRPGVTATDCDGAFSTLLADLAAQGTLNEEAELISDARALVEPDGTAGTADLCSPPVAGGYLGAENQAIRVQLVSPNQFTWGFDNGSPLYRVQLAKDDAGVARRIVMLTEPADQAHWPISGQVVELLPWSAALVNNQKLAESHGHLARVNGTYNPDTKTFFVDVAPPPPAGLPPHPFGEHWRERSDPSLGDAGMLDDEGEFFYLRVWNRGSDLASPPRIPFVPGTAVSLAHTGLKITFNGTQFRLDDFWIIAARPDSPTLLVPWDLDPLRPPNGIVPYDGRRAHGVRRWFTPLGVIQWTPGNPPAGVVFHDCRDFFPPLTRIRNCCTFTVGNGVTSFGHFNSIQQAVNQLPVDGGLICLLPGVYRENVRIVNRRNITISGCGRRSIVRSREAKRPAAAPPVISIIGGFGITLEYFAVEADPTGLGILIRGLNPYSKERQESAGEVVRVRLCKLIVTAVLQSAVRARFVRELNISFCTLTNFDETNAGQTLVVLGDDVLIERNVVEVGVRRRERDVPVDPAEPPALFAPGNRARGGVQIEGMSDRVRIINNLIRGGSSNGITLGSIVLILPDGPDGPKDDDDDLPPIDPCNPCDPIDDIPDGPPDGPGGRWMDGGPLSEIRIERNRIYQMGACGIGVARFFNLRGRDAFIHVDGLTILGNHIRECLQREIAEAPPLLAPFVGYGGISLADVHQLVIYDNVIEQCGLSPREAVCGIFVLQVEGCDIARNRVLENGAISGVQFDHVANAKIGHRGGIVIAFALAPSPGAASAPTKLNVGIAVNAVIALPTGEPAARIHDNIVTAPAGRSLHLNALGAVSVEGNHFTTRSVPPGFSAAFSSQLAATVWLLNLGFSNEYYLGFLLFSAAGKTAPVFQPGLDRFGIGRSLANGEVLFTDNHVNLDALNPTNTFALSSIMIVTADDLGFQDNQSVSNLLNDFVVTNSILLGFTSRTNSNRFTEGMLNAFFSAVTLGFIANTTTLNQATHCIISLGLRLKVALNTEIVGVNPLFGGGDLTCDEIQRRFAK